MKTIVWVANHPMAPRALVEWFATSDAEEDIRRNYETWRVLVDRATTGVAGEQPVIAGVFPPVALEALFEADFSGYMAPRVLTPISRPSALLVDELAVPIEVTHLRWVQLASMA